MDYAWRHRRCCLPVMVPEVARNASYPDTPASKNEKMNYAVTKPPRLKNPVVAAILGFFFAPFSTLYFGWRILFTTLLAVSFIGIAFAFIFYLTPS